MYTKPLSRGVCTTRYIYVCKSLGYLLCNTIFHKNNASVSSSIRKKVESEVLKPDMYLMRKTFSEEIFLLTVDDH